MPRSFNPAFDDTSEVLVDVDTNLPELADALHDAAIELDYSPGIAVVYSGDRFTVPSDVAANAKLGGATVSASSSPNAPASSSAPAKRVPAKRAPAKKAAPRKTIAK